LPNQHLMPSKPTTLFQTLRNIKDAPRVLIVEDQIEYAKVLRRALIEFDPPYPDLHVEWTSDPRVARQHVDRDDIDIYIVDLKFPDEENQSVETPEIGRELAKDILQKTEAGLIVHSSLDADPYSIEFMMLGADDYIQKGERGDPIEGKREGSRVLVEEQKLYTYIKLKVISVWRRVQNIRPEHSRNLAHTNRTFLVGDWKFTVRKRDLVNQRGQTIRITSSEHALLEYLCLVQDHEIDVRTINLDILKRQPEEAEKRVDNHIYRMRTRLGPSVELVSNREGKYRLLTVNEVLSQEAS
jgi:DNA-binding response OmpR family regulator